MNDLRRYTLTGDDREYADAPTLPDALAGAKVIAAEEGITITVLRPGGAEIAWASPDGTTRIIQGASRAARTF